MMENEWEKGGGWETRDESAIAESGIAESGHSHDEGWSGVYMNIWSYIHMILFAYDHINIWAYIHM